MIFPRSNKPMTPSEFKHCLYCGASYTPLPPQGGTYKVHYDGFCTYLHAMYAWKFTPDPAKNNINREDLTRHNL